MARLTKRTLLAFVIATLAGTCLHFLYVLLPNPVTALFSPVNESLWEHLKILFWPGLAASLILVRLGERPPLGPRLLAILAAAVLMQAVGYLYHIVLSGDSLAFDIGLYVLLMAAVLLLPALPERPVPAGGRGLLVLLTIALAAALFLFTFLPPRLILFADLSAANTWSTIPC